MRYFGLKELGIFWLGDSGFKVEQNAKNWIDFKTWGRWGIECHDPAHTLQTAISGLSECWVNCFVRCV